MLNRYSDRVVFDFVNCYKIGKIVTLQFRVRFVEKFPANVNIFQLEQSVSYPKTSIKIPAMVVNYDKVEIYFIEIDSQGYIQQNIGTNVTEITAFGSYVV